MGFSCLPGTSVVDIPDKAPYDEVPWQLERYEHKSMEDKINKEESEEVMGMIEVKKKKKMNDKKKNEKFIYITEQDKWYNDMLDWWVLIQENDGVDSVQAVIEWLSPNPNN